MIRSLLSIAVLLSTLLCVGRAIQSTHADDQSAPKNTADKPTPAADSASASDSATTPPPASSTDQADTPTGSPAAQKPSDKPVLRPLSETKKATGKAPNKRPSSAIQLIPAIDPIDVKTQKEDMAGTDETPARPEATTPGSASAPSKDASEPKSDDAASKSQTSPNPADVPESAEATDEDAEKMPAKDAASPSPKSETPAESSDDETAPTTPAAQQKDGEKKSESSDKSDNKPAEKNKTDADNSDVVKPTEPKSPTTTPATEEPATAGTDSPPAEKKFDARSMRRPLMRETPIREASPPTDAPVETKVVPKSEAPKTATNPPAKAPDIVKGVAPKEEPAKETAPVVPSTKNDRPLPLPKELVETRDRVRHCLKTYFNEPINTAEYSPWGIMHALIAFGVDTEVYAGNRKVNAIGWLCYNGPCRGMQMMYVNKEGKLRLRLGPGYQGHEGQFLAMLAQSRVKTDFPIRVDGRDFTVADLIESEKETCRPKTELTFKLIGLSHYLDTGASWRSETGEHWDIPRLIREELAQPIVGAACGGTHRLTGFSYAVNKRTRLDESFDGQWLRAKQFLLAYHDYIFRLQNYDGSFSTKWFAAREDWGDLDRRVQTTGHMLEWLVCSLPREQLDDPRVIRAVNYLTDILIDGAYEHKKWEIGPRGHAIHALALYAERRYGDKAGHRDEMLAKRPSTRVVNTPSSSTTVR